MDSAPFPPKRLGRYRVGAKIAGGGMASVYLGRARGPDGTDEVVALKVIKDEHRTKKEYVQMFLDEARILSRLSHPNVIATVDSGVDQELRFIAMELLLGRSVADAWNTTRGGQKFPRDLAAWIVARTADGLQYAHDITDDEGTPLKVIHRDVNPTNIFLTYDGHVKLIDFGLAKVVGRKSQSVQGVVKGKIPYLAPEQIRGLDVDGRVDVYGLGITLWELTVGRRLFKRETDVATLQAIEKAEVPDAREIVPGYPDELWKIVSSMLEVDRDKRISSGREVAKAIDAYLGERDDQKRGEEIAAFLDECFPGEREEQASWLRDAARVKRAVSTATVPPPAPVPALLDSSEGRAARLAGSGSGPSAVAATQREDAGTNGAAKKRDSEAPKSKRGKSVRPPRDAKEAKASPSAPSRSQAKRSAMSPSMIVLALAAAVVVLYAFAHH